MLWKDLEAKLMLRGLDQGLVRDLIWASLGQGELKVISDAQMVEGKDLSGEVPDERIAGAIESQLSGKLVATSPISGLPKDLPSTISVFRLITAVASSRLDIVSPYIDDSGVSMLRDALLQAAERRVQVRIITREARKPHASRLRGLAEIAAIASPQLSVRDYHTQKGEYAHFTSVHAKLVLADERIGYVGSAELRGNALVKNFELGSVLTGSAAQLASQSFDALWRVAQPVAIPPRS